MSWALTAVLAVRAIVCCPRHANRRRRHRSCSPSEYNRRSRSRSRSPHIHHNIDEEHKEHDAAAAAGPSPPAQREQLMSAHIPSLPRTCSVHIQQSTCTTVCEHARDRRAALRTLHARAWAVRWHRTAGDNRESFPIVPACTAQSRQRARSVLALHIPYANPDRVECAWSRGLRDLTAHAAAARSDRRQIRCLRPPKSMSSNTFNTTVDTPKTQEIESHMPILLIACATSGGAMPHHFFRKTPLSHCLEAKHCLVDFSVSSLCSRAVQRVGVPLLRQAAEQVA